VAVVVAYIATELLGARRNRPAVVGTPAPATEGLPPHV